MAIWKQHPRFEHYEVSDDGRVRSLDRFIQTEYFFGHWHLGRELSITFDSAGYPQVGINGSRTRVHVLVCETFHGPKSSRKRCVRHLNGIKTDNRAENLKWGTHSENSFDTVLHGGNKCASRNHCAKGHEYTAENLTRGPRGTRGCKECNREYSRKNYQKNVKPRQALGGGEVKNHGKTGYHYGCRCDTCRGAYSAYKRDYRRARAKRAA